MYILLYITSILLSFVFKCVSTGGLIPNAGDATLVCSTDGVWRKPLHTVPQPPSEAIRLHFQKMKFITYYSLYNALKILFNY